MASRSKIKNKIWLKKLKKRVGDAKNNSVQKRNLKK